uniref:Secreted protein n=1 Tax=Populus trichocarpa TaxID=3694 RepID=A0A3N7HI39_POPTR
MPLSLCFSPLPLHLCFLSFSQWSSCGWNPVNVVCFSVFYSLWQTPYALRFRMLFVALFVTLSLQSLCYRSGSAIEWGLCAFMVAKHLQVCFVQNSIEARPCTAISHTSLAFNIS